MSNALDAAKELLAKIEDGLPFTVNEVTNPEDETVIATIRNKDNRPVLLPHPEAMSLLTGQRDVFEFFIFAPKVLQDLIASVEENNKTSQSVKPSNRENSQE